MEIFRLDFRRYVLWRFGIATNTLFLHIFRTTTNNKMPTLVRCASCFASTGGYTCTSTYLLRHYKVIAANKVTEKKGEEEGALTLPYSRLLCFVYDIAINLVAWSLLFCSAGACMYHRRHIFPWECGPNDIRSYTMRTRGACRYTQWVFRISSKRRRWWWWRCSR